MSSRAKRTTATTTTLKPVQAKAVRTKVEDQKKKKTWSIALGVVLLALAAWILIGLFRGGSQVPNLFLGTRPVDQGSSMAVQAQQQQNPLAQLGAVFQGRATAGCPEQMRYSCEALPEEQQAQCRQQKVQMLQNGQCAELSQVDPVTGGVCYDLFRYGQYPKGLNLSVTPRPLVPSNFADQKCAGEPIPGRFPPALDSSNNDQWTLDLASQDSIDQAAPYQSALRTPTWNEMLYNPGALQAVRANGAASDIDTVQPMPQM